jgi:signal transduction histidine kinase
MADPRESNRHPQHRAPHHLRAASISTPSDSPGAFTHELAQPLTAILANAEAALQIAGETGTVPTEIREILGDIIRDDLHALEIIGRLRSLFARRETQRRSVELNQIVSDVLAAVQGDLDAHEVTVTTELTAQQTFVLVDEVQIQQVLLNLVVNACDAMADLTPGEREITVATRAVADGQAVECSVTDRGRGIAASDFDRIFEPFVTTKKRGLGLGLAICRSIIAAHAGRLWAENTGEQGATFRFALSTGAPGYGA